MDLVHVRHADARAVLAPRTPLTPVVLCTAGAAVVLGFGALFGLDGDSLLVAPISLVLFGGLLAVRRWDERRHSRADADAWIARGHDRHLAARYGWRIGELTSRRERQMLGCSVREIVPSLSPGRLQGASPLNRVALRPHRDGLIALADRLDDLEQPVSAAGILAVRRLLTEPDSVLYHRPLVDERPRDIGAELGVILDRLEVRH